MWCFSVINKTQYFLPSANGFINNLSLKNSLQSFNGVLDNTIVNVRFLFLFLSDEINDQDMNNSYLCLFMLIFGRYLVVGKNEWSAWRMKRRQSYDDKLSGGMGIRDVIILWILADRMEMRVIASWMYKHVGVGFGGVVFSLSIPWPCVRYS